MNYARVGIRLTGQVWGLHDSAMKTAPRTIGEAIRLEREARGWKRWQLAEKVRAIRADRTDPKKIERWELGHTKPSQDSYEDLCRIFDWPLPYNPEEDSDTRAYLNGSVVVDLRPEAIAHPFAPDLALAA